MKGFKVMIPLRSSLFGRMGWWFLCSLLFSFVSVSTQAEENSVYSLYISQNSQPLAVLALPATGEFIITYVHSIHKRPVYEYYRAEQGKLHLYELWYDTTSTGMPSDAEGAFRLENGFFILTLDRLFQTLPLFVSPIPGHGVIIEGRLYLFTEWVAAESALELSVKESSAAEFAPK
ncbi:MAG: DUF1850 domain-containing protein [Treponema sp.]|nr:DUF1850 domain-containing protein [Treponema sp.]